MSISTPVRQAHRCCLGIDPSPVGRVDADKTQDGIVVAEHDRWVIAALSVS